MPIVAPYGSWTSPITLDLVAGAGGVSYGFLWAADEGVYWLETRPQEQGRSALVLLPQGGEPIDVVPQGFNVRTRVHEYGGGAWFCAGGVVYCSSFDDSRLYRIDAPGAEPRPITSETHEPHVLRYADGRVFAASAYGAGRSPFGILGKADVTRKSPAPQAMAIPAIKAR